MIEVKQLMQVLIIPMATIRRQGRSLFPARDWDEVSEAGEIATEEGLCIALVHHWIVKDVLDEVTALSAALSVRDAVTRYAGALNSMVRSGVGDVPMMTVEVADQRWVRAGRSAEVFDLQEQMNTAPQPRAMPLSSYSVSLGMLFLLMHPMEASHAASNVGSAEAAHSAPG